MAEYPSIVLTNSGLEMIAESQAGQNLIFTKLKIGDGSLGAGESISTLTGVKSPKLDIPIQGYTNQGNGQVRLRYLVDNSGVAVNQGFFAREVGVYAKIGEAGTERLYAYTNGGNKVDWIPDKNTPLDAQIFDVFVLIGNASNVTVVINGSATYATKLDLTEHNEDEDAHDVAFENHNADAAAHPQLLQTVTGLISEANKKISGIGRNMLIKGVYDGDGKPAPLYSAKTNGNIKLQEGTLLTFAAGMSDDGAVDHKALLLADVTKTLAAADANTIPLSYTEDLCNGGMAISGGDSAGPASNAFNNNLTQGWSASQMAANQLGNAWIGYDFGASNAKRIRRITMYTAATAAANIGAIKAKYSDNGTTWTEVTPYSYDKAKVSQWVPVDLPDVGAHQYWQILANANLVNGDGWWIYEIEMYEALQTHYLLADRAADGTVSLVSTKEKPKLVNSGTTTVVDGYYTNQCFGGTPISGGDYVSRPKEYAFDGFYGDTLHGWQSSQKGSGNINNIAWIGYDFGAFKSIHKIRYMNAQSASFNTYGVKIQKSDDLLTWVDVTTAATIITANAWVDIELPSTVNTRALRIIATNHASSSQYWALYEIEMLTYTPPQTLTNTDDTMYTENRCIAGAAISGGDYSTNYKEYAFNGVIDNDGKMWQGAQVANNQNGAAYIGYDFGVDRHIRRIIFNQATASVNAMTAVKIQRSTDGASWSDAYTTTLTPGNNNIELPSTAAARFWRVLAQANLGGTYAWVVLEISMYELSSDINLYDPIKGLSRHFDGNTWADVERVYAGKATVNSAGVITSYECEPYNLARLEIRDAELSTEPVSLGQFNQFCKCVAWVNFNGTGVVAIRAGMNVSSVTDNGVADYTVNFATPLIDSNYAHVATLSDSGGTPYAPLILRTNVLPGSIRINQMTSVNGPGTNLDWADCNVVIFR